MCIKCVITFSNCTENGVVEPEKCYNKTVLGYVSETLAGAAKCSNVNLDNCTAYPVSGMYKGISENSFRLEYILSAPISGFFGYVEWIRKEYEQDSVLLEVYSNSGYKAFLIYGLDNYVEL